LFNQKDIHMHLTHIFAAGSGFRVLDTTERSQTGLLTLEAGEATGEKPSRHEDSDQTLILLAGELRAEIGDEKETMEEWRCGAGSGEDAASLHPYREEPGDDFQRLREARISGGQAEQVERVMHFSRRSAVL